MPSPHKIISYTLGFGLGCLIATSIFFAKSEVKKERQAELDVFKPSQYIPGFDSKGHSPISTTFCIDFKDYETQEDGTFKRVLVMEGRGDFPFWRAEEMLTIDPQFNEEKLIMRQFMAADQLVVRLNPDTGSLEKLRPILRSQKMRVLGPGKKEGLYQVKLPDHNPETLSLAIDHLLSHKDVVAGAVPLYIKKSR